MEEFQQLLLLSILGRVLVVVIPLGMIIAAIIYFFYKQEHSARKHADDIIAVHVKRCPLCKSTDLETGDFRMGNANFPFIRTSTRNRISTAVIRCKSCGYVIWFSEPDE